MVQPSLFFLMLFISVNRQKNKVVKKKQCPPDTMYASEQHTLVRDRIEILIRREGKKRKAEQKMHILLSSFIILCFFRSFIMALDMLIIRI